MLTDGIVEITNTGDEEFGLQRVERLLQENAGRPLAEISDDSSGEDHGIRPLNCKIKEDWPHGKAGSRTVRET
jgi:hypothetical protein